VSILWSSWKVKTKWEFFLSWWAVVLATVIYYGVRFLIHLIEDQMESSASVTVRDVRGSNNSPSYQGNNEVNQPMFPKDDEHADLVEDAPAHKDISVTKYMWLRLLHAVLSGLNYGLALLLMLVAMTFNPSLFLALMTGYSIGDFVFYSKMRKHSLADCHS
jgi:hypothetical protein